jgi:hypothetical protein
MAKRIALGLRDGGIRSAIPPYRLPRRSSGGITALRVIALIVAGLAKDFVADGDEGGTFTSNAWHIQIFVRAC